MSRKKYRLVNPPASLPTHTSKGARIFVTADEHFRHKKINLYNGRPFASVEEGDDTLILNHNSLVRECDHVIHVGDTCLGSAEDLISILRKLNGNHYLMDGSHDWALAEMFHVKGIPQDLAHRVTILPKIFEFKFNGEDITFLHYAMAKWAKSHYGSIHFFGHSHNHYNHPGRAIDVGVDCHNFYPLPIETGIELAKAKPFEPNHPRRPKP